MSKKRKIHGNPITVLHNIKKYHCCYFVRRYAYAFLPISPISKNSKLPEIMKYNYHINTLKIYRFLNQKKEIL